MESGEILLRVRDLAERVRRHGGGAPPPEGPKPECSSGDKGAYDTPWHVFALFLILFLSTLACAAPLITSRGGHKSRRAAVVIFACQHFGTGVLIATAFVHLLPTAFESLTDPCLPDVFNVGYPPLAGLVAMIAALGVVWIEQALATRGAGHSHAHHHGWDDDSEDEGRNEDPESGGRTALQIPENYSQLSSSEEAGLINNAAIPSTLAPAPRVSIRVSSESDADLDISLEELSASEAPSLNTPSLNTPAPTTPTTPLPQLTPEERHRMVLQCMLLEAGILFHSIFIGMAVSVATGPAFVVFLVAICFHQVFEGLALGSRIAALQFPRSSPRPWLMALAYGITTPLGQAIGLAMHNLYDPRSVAGLLMVGFTNAISAGLLLFAGLVQLLAEDFLSEKSYATLKGKRRQWAFVAVVGGATLMAVVGAFA